MNTLSMIKPIALLALCGFAISSTSVEARGPANPEAAKKLAEPCQACHGANGVATAPIYPHLAGQYADYLARALHEYRDGGRNNPIMAVYVEKLSCGTGYLPLVKRGYHPECWRTCPGRVYRSD